MQHNERTGRELRDELLSEFAVRSGPDWQPTVRLRLYRARSWHPPRLQQAWEDRASTAALWPVEWRDVPVVSDEI